MILRLKDITLREIVEPLGTAYNMYKGKEVVKLFAQCSLGFFWMEVMKKRKQKKRQKERNYCTGLKSIFREFYKKFFKKRCS